MDVREKLVEIVCDAMENGVCSGYCNYSPCFGVDRVVNALIANGVTVQEWVSVKDKMPDKDGQYIIFTTKYFAPDHIDEIDHIDGIEISGYSKRYGFLSKNGIHAKYWRDIPQTPKGE